MNPTQRALEVFSRDKSVNHLERNSQPSAETNTDKILEVLPRGVALTLWCGGGSLQFLWYSGSYSISSVVGASWGIVPEHKLLYPRAGHGTLSCLGKTRPRCNKIGKKDDKRGEKEKVKRGKKILKINLNIRKP